MFRERAAVITFRRGIEPPTNWLKANRSTSELPEIKIKYRPIVKRMCFGSRESIDAHNRVRNFTSPAHRVEESVPLIAPLESPKRIRSAKRVRKTALPRVYVTEQPAGDTDVACSICFENAVRIVYIPCGHITACLSCTKNNMDAFGIVQCVICSRRITKVIQFFESGYV